jgi:hypothetical protein
MPVEVELRGATLAGLSADAQRQLEAIKAAAEDIGLAKIVVTAGREGGHLSHGRGTEMDIYGVRPDGTQWSREQRVQAAAVARGAGADRFGFYENSDRSFDPMLHFGNSGPGRPSAMWGANDRTSGARSREYRDASERAFYAAFEAGKPYETNSPARTNAYQAAGGTTPAVAATRAMSMGVTPQAAYQPSTLSAPGPSPVLRQSAIPTSISSGVLTGGTQVAAAKPSQSMGVRPSGPTVGSLFAGAVNPAAASAARPAQQQGGIAGLFGLGGSRIGQAAGNVGRAIGGGIGVGASTMFPAMGGRAVQAVGGTMGRGAMGVASNYAPSLPVQSDKFARAREYGVEDVQASRRSSTGGEDKFTGTKDGRGVMGWTTSKGDLVVNTERRTARDDGGLYRTEIIRDKDSERRGGSFWDSFRR